MAESKMDRRELAKLPDLAETLVRLQIMAIKSGIPASETFDAFAKTYLHHLLRELDDEALRCLFLEIPPLDQRQSSNTLIGLALPLGIKISSSFLKAVTAEINERNSRT